MHQHSGWRKQTYFKHASFFMNAGKGTCLNKFKAKTQSPPPIMSQISWSWASLVCKDLGIILSNSTILLCSHYMKISYKWWAYISKSLCQFCQITWHVITDQYSCVTNAKKNMLSVWTQFSQQAGTMMIWSHNTFYKPQHSHICHHCDSVTIKCWI
jgi:hypothetical protein